MLGDEGLQSVHHDDQVTYDPVLRQIENAAGRWQWRRIQFMLLITGITSGLSHNSVRILDNFHGGYIRCRNPYCEDATSGKDWHPDGVLLTSYGLSNVPCTYLSLATLVALRTHNGPSMS